MKRLSILIIFILFNLNTIAQVGFKGYYIGEKSTKTPTLTTLGGESGRLSAKMLIDNRIYEIQFWSCKKIGEMFGTEDMCIESNCLFTEQRNIIIGGVENKFGISFSEPKQVVTEGITGTKMATLNRSMIKNGYKYRIYETTCDNRYRDPTTSMSIVVTITSLYLEKISKQEAMREREKDKEKKLSDFE